MADFIDQIRGLFELYPKWLVVTCLAIVGVGVGYVLWRVVKFGLMLVLTPCFSEKALAVFIAWRLASPVMR